MAVIKSRSNWELQTEQSNKTKGPLIKVEIRTGQFLKMYESDAIAKGLIQKKAPPGKNKMITPGGNKKQDPAPDKNKAPTPEKTETENQSDDFTEISGVGPATQRALKTHGIETFQDLMMATDLSFLTPGVVEVIEKWRVENG